MTGPVPNPVPSLGSLREGYRAIVFGASGGIGAALVEALAADNRCALVHSAARRSSFRNGKIVPMEFSFDEEASVAACIAEATVHEPLDLVIVATGQLHDGDLKPEKTWRGIRADAMERALRINTVGPALVARHALDHLSTEPKAVFAALSARVGSISDNRLGGWHSYRAAKAALNMLLRTFSIELARRNPVAICVSLHPGTVDTRLSKPFQSGIPADRLFTPSHSAGLLMRVIDGLTAKDSGGFFAWDGSPIPY